MQTIRNRFANLRNVPLSQDIKADESTSAGNTDATTATTPSKKETPPEDDFDWGLADHDSVHREGPFSFWRVVREIRSAFFIRLLHFGFPRKESGLLYFLMIQFHEDIYSPLKVYSAIPAALIWFFPNHLSAYGIGPLQVYGLTRGFDSYKRTEYSNTKGMWVYGVPLALASFFFATFILFTGSSEPFEFIFGPVSTWPAALLPIVPGMFLRLVNERPNSINGFVPENKQGIVLAIIARACTAVLGQTVLWGIWASYTAPSVDCPSMFIEWIFCTFCWIFGQVSPAGVYALWLLVNQYRHAESWFRRSGGGPSVVLLRERRGTIWYILTFVILQSIENEAGPKIMESEMLILYPQVWIPLALIMITGLYLLKYGLMLRIYKFKHKPLAEGKNFRLLRLRAQPCLPNSPIICDIIHTSLHRPPQYIAVSHRWDAYNAPQEMILIEGGLFSVSRSIYSLLLAKRSNLHPQYFWIDSICINQEDSTEKSKQVGFMRNIFEEAEKTLGWLGDDPSAKNAFDLVRKMSRTSSQETFSKLLKEPEACWHDFNKLLRNEWFERVWIVQEIATAKDQILRYGNEEMEWVEFSSALSRFMLFGSDYKGSINPLVYQGGLFTALVMEEVRSRVANVDFVKMKDTLKLALGFKATLPIDKVYALLGLVDERHTPLFHPRFGMAGKIMDKRYLWKDVLETTRLIGELLGTASGRTNSRRARAILASGTRNSLRYTKVLMRDLRVITDRIKQWDNGTSTMEEDSIQPDYTGKSTTPLVYLYVARDLTKAGDGLSFVRHAGLGSPRHQELEPSPSWVPDWSSGISTHMLPWRMSGGTTGETVFQCQGSKILLIRASLIGAITHSAKLARDYPFLGKIATQEDIEKDSASTSQAIQHALDLAEQFAQPEYRDGDNMHEAFSKVLTADTLEKDTFTAFLMRDWTVKLPRDTCASICRPRSLQERWNEVPTSYQREFPHFYRDISQEYSQIRRMTSSKNAKLAHLVCADISPSFSQYRDPAQDHNKTTNFSMLKKENINPLTKLAEYVDYTINRSFVITESGLMGIAPESSEPGDIIIQATEKGRIIWLVLREEAMDAEQVSGEFSEGYTADGLGRCRFRLVGEAYVHLHDAETSKVREMQTFKVW